MNARSLMRLRLTTAATEEIGPTPHGRLSIVPIAGGSFVPKHKLTQTRRSDPMTVTPDALKAAQTYAIDKTHSEVAFQVRHLLTNVRGRFTEFTGTVVFDQEHPEHSSASLMIDASSVDTGTPDRDIHLRADDFFAVGTHPMLTFTSSRVVKAGDETDDVVGTLTIRGIAKEITMPVTYLGTAKDPWGNLRANLSIQAIAQ
jgi:polyisoprenoid-binding protein YceI